MNVDREYTGIPGLHQSQPDSAGDTCLLSPASHAFAAQLWQTATDTLPPQQPAEQQQLLASVSLDATPIPPALAAYVQAGSASQASPQSSPHAPVHAATILTSTATPVPVACVSPPPLCAWQAGAGAGEPNSRPSAWTNLLQQSALASSSSPTCASLGGHEALPAAAVPPTVPYERVHMPSLPLAIAQAQQAPMSFLHSTGMPAAASPTFPPWRSLGHIGRLTSLPGLQAEPEAAIPGLAAAAAAAADSLAAAGCITSNSLTCAPDTCVADSQVDHAFAAPAAPVSAWEHVSQQHASTGQAVAQCVSQPPQQLRTAAAGLWASMPDLQQHPGGRKQAEVHGQPEQKSGAHHRAALR